MILTSKIQMIGAGVALIVALMVGMQIGAWKKGAEFILVERGLNKDNTSLRNQVIVLNTDVSNLKAAISSQNAAVDLLVAETKAAGEVKAEAQKRADNLAIYSRNRLDRIELLIPNAKDCSDVLSKYWGERKLEFSF